MMAAWRQVKNSAPILLVFILVVYMGYCTQELYHRIQNTRKLQRLRQYEKEVDELNIMLQDYKRDANTVRRSLKLLREAFDQIVLNQRTADNDSR